MMYVLWSRRSILLAAFLLHLISISVEGETLRRELNSFDTRFMSERRSRNKPVFIHKGKDEIVAVMDYTPVRRQRPIHN